MINSPVKTLVDTLVNEASEHDGVVSVHGTFRIL